MTLSERRQQLCLKFAKYCLKNPVTKQMYPLKVPNGSMQTRNNKKYEVQKARMTRLYKSSIPYMQRLLNTFDS